MDTVKSAASGLPTQQAIDIWVDVTLVAEGQGSLKRLEKERRKNSFSAYEQVVNEWRYLKSLYTCVRTRCVLVIAARKQMIKDGYLDTVRFLEYQRALGPKSRSSLET
jgi:hypothetical protein